MHLAYIVVFILFLIKYFFLDFLPTPGLLWVSGTQAPRACKTSKQPEELVASRKLVVDPAKWWMQKLQLKWNGVSFRLWRRGDPQSELKCFVTLKVCPIPDSSECFLRFGVCVGLLATVVWLHRWLCFIQEKNLLWRFLDPFTSSFETELWID